MKAISTIFMIFAITVCNSNKINAEVISGDDLTTAGSALANYQLCADIAVSLQDRSMSLYYEDMYRDSITKYQMLPIWQVEMIFAAQESTEDKLLKLDRSSYQALCLSRFDAITRKIYDTKVDQEIKARTNSL